MGANARKLAVKEVGPVTEDRSRPTARARFWVWLRPYVDIFARETAKSVGRQMGPTIKWAIFGTVTSGGAIAVAKLITDILTN